MLYKSKLYWGLVAGLILFFGVCIYVIEEYPNNQVVSTPSPKTIPWVTSTPYKGSLGTAQPTTKSTSQPQANLWSGCIQGICYKNITTEERDLIMQREEEIANKQQAVRDTQDFIDSINNQPDIPIPNPSQPNIDSYLPDIRFDNPPAPSQQPCLNTRSNGCN